MTRLKAAAERRRQEAMESLSLEGRAIYKIITVANDKWHEKLKAELRELIVTTVAESMDRTVDKFVSARVNAVVDNMQVYTDGMEADLRSALGLASPDDDTMSSLKSPRGTLRSALVGTTLHGLCGGRNLRPIRLIFLLRLKEEVMEDDQDYFSPQWRRPQSAAFSRQYKTLSPKVVEEQRSFDVVTTTPESDKLATMKAYRRAKGLCFICGERWRKDHKCSAIVQLHIVQEMLEFCTSEQADSEKSE